VRTQQAKTQVTALHSGETRSRDKSQVIRGFHPATGRSLRWSAVERQRSEIIVVVLVCCTLPEDHRLSLGGPVDPLD
jgi:hypothetical protein